MKRSRLGRPLRVITALAYLLGTASLALGMILSLSPALSTEAGTSSWTSPDGTMTVSFTTPDTYSACPATTTTDTLTTSGIPSNWTLRGRVTVAYVTDGGRVQIQQYNVDQSGDLNLTISYPPIPQWPVQSNGTAEIHVDISIRPYDENGQNVTWIGNFPGVLGPGNQWDVYCIGQPTATPPVTNTPTATATMTETPLATNTPTATATVTDTPVATITPTAPTEGENPTATPVPTNTPVATNTATPETPEVNLHDPKRVSLTSDIDGNGAPSPGDVLTYDITITNVGGIAAEGVVFSDTPDPNTTLIAGSVTTSLGTVTTGNNSGDLSVVVDIGTISPATTVTITFQVTINADLPEDVRTVANQGLLTGQNFPDRPTDDPDTPPPDDETVTVLVREGPPSPTQPAVSTEAPASITGTGAPGPVLIPVTGDDLSGVRWPRPALFFNLGMAFLGIGLMSHGALRRKRIPE